MSASCSPHPPCRSPARSKACVDDSRIRRKEGDRDGRWTGGRQAARRARAHPGRAARLAGALVEEDRAIPPRLIGRVQEDISRIERSPAATAAPSSGRSAPPIGPTGRQVGRSPAIAAGEATARASAMQTVRPATPGEGDEGTCFRLTRFAGHRLGSTRQAAASPTGHVRATPLRSPAGPGLRQGGRR